MADSKVCINGYKFNAISGGPNIVIITLARTWVSEWLIPFVPLLILLIYASRLLFILANA